LVGETVGFALGKRSPSRPERLEKMLSGGPLELEKLLDRDHCREGLALPLDDELIVPQGDAIQIFAETLPNLHGRYLLRHEAKYINS
jgi:hypothetical protein